MNYKSLLEDLKNGKCPECGTVGYIEKETEESTPETVIIANYCGECNYTLFCYYELKSIGAGGIEYREE